ncbi:Eef2k, partial [Symbiodinium necroappetens]
PFHFCGEKYLSGTWVKFNNNDGYVSEDLSKHSAVAQAFSHFTFERSGHRLMVVDLQGVCEERNSELVFRLTDPQVHSSRKWKRQSESFPERFGKGDFGEDGFSAFFQNYVYNKLSKDLGLRDELDVREPTETAYIPAVREYFEEFKTWLSHAREQLEWDLNEYCGPQEFDDNAYWFPVKIWAKKTNAQQALQDIQDKVEAVLAKRLRKLPVAQTGDEDGSKWEDKMSEWRQRFAATTLPWPPGFPRSPLKEVWVVADQAAEQEDITALHEEIEQALAEVSGSAAGGEASAWQKWFDENHQDWYFWNDISYDAFWPQEGHSGDWSWHIVGGNRKEWVNKAAGKSFFEDTAVDKRPVNKQS